MSCLQLYLTVMLTSWLALPTQVVAQGNSVSSADGTRGIAVVELFTSQGCSSCPPADAALRRIVDVAQRNQLPVFALSFHVDYWNRLGWTDPYSDAAFSQRQRAYASAMNSNRVYTPQMIVNGTTEFVGSNKQQANTTITDSLKHPAQASVELQAGKIQRGNRVSIAYDVQGIRQGTVLNVALVHSPAANRVPSGENAGRSLAHVDVVRDFKTVPLDHATGEVELTLPSDVTRSDASVIAFVQNQNNLKIVAAAELRNLTGVDETPASRDR